MIRGTTPKLDFVLPFSTERIATCFVTIEQGNRIVLEKSLADCELDGNTLSCHLTQSETLMLDARANAEIQLRILTTDGQALASDIYHRSVGRILKDGEI